VSKPVVVDTLVSTAVAGVLASIKGGNYNTQANQVYTDGRPARVIMDGAPNVNTKWFGSVLTGREAGWENYTVTQRVGCVIRYEPGDGAPLFDPSAPDTDKKTKLAQAWLADLRKALYANQLAVAQSLEMAGVTLVEMHPPSNIHALLVALPVKLPAEETFLTDIAYIECDVLIFVRHPYTIQ